MTREDALGLAGDAFDGGAFFEALARRVAIPSVSIDPGLAQELPRYLTEGLGDQIERLGCQAEIHDNPVAGVPPILVARRFEDAGLPTLLTYGHGDVVPGMAGRWSEDRDPWCLTKEGGRWYGRGTADNKGQHTINLTALESVLQARGRLGFNLIILMEMGEEAGSPGLREFCEAERETLKADLFIASDGPRLQAETPTLFLGARGCYDFEMTVSLRKGYHHSGNWGGLLANPAVILAHALASLTDARGRILVPEWRPAGIPDAVRQAVRDLRPGGGVGPTIDADWGEPGLSPGEQVFAWNSFEVLAFEAGDPASPAAAVPPEARATCALRYVVPCDPEQFLPALRRHLDDRGLERVALRELPGHLRATRLDPGHPRVAWALKLLGEVSGKDPVLLPNLGGSLPNDVFAEVLGLPTLWVPHSYPACRQHGPDEHLLAPVVREALLLMTALFWDLGAEEPG